MIGHRLETRIINPYGLHLFGADAKEELNQQVFSRLLVLSQIFKAYRPTDDVLCMALVKIQGTFAVQQVEDKQVSLEKDYPVVIYL